jgi:hypothetical protein
MAKCPSLKVYQVPGIAEPSSIFVIIFSCAKKLASQFDYNLNGRGFDDFTFAPEFVKRMSPPWEWI